MAIRNVICGRYITVVTNRLVRPRINLSQCLVVACSFFSIWILYDAFLADYSNFGLGEWEILRPDAKQACVHPRLPVYNPKMMQYIRKLNPIRCPDEPDWIFTAHGRIFISQEAVALHGTITCFMTPVFMENDDFSPTKGKEVLVVNGTLLQHDAFISKCRAKDGKTYENIHNGITRRDVLKQKFTKVKGSKGLNVVIWGTDSMSSLMFQRLLPKSHEYFTKHLGGILLEGYNIIGDGTAQAWIPILTGKTQFEQPDTQKGADGANFCDIYPLLWKEYEHQGYITHFAEDDPNWAMFNYKLKGFKQQPTHHYMRPFHIEAAKYTSSVYLPFDSRPSKYCLGSKPRPRLMFDWVKESFETYPDRLKFSISFAAELTHEYNDFAQFQEPYLLEFLQTMNSKSYLNNTVIILMSDHGARFNRFRATEQGKLEERMPYFAFRFPGWFKRVYPREFNNFLANSQRLTTPFDIHETLLELIGITPSKDIHGISLFKEIPLERTCSQAHIEPHYCACLKWEKVAGDDADVVAAAKAVIDAINNLLKPFSSDCHLLMLNYVKEGSKFSTNEDVLKFHESPSGVGEQPDMSDNMKAQDTLILVTFVTKPMDGLFEATTRKRTSDGKILVDMKQISRINKYGNTSSCIKLKATQLLPYCICKPIS